MGYLHIFTISTGAGFLPQRVGLVFLCWVGFVPDFSPRHEKLGVVKVVRNNSSDRFLGCIFIWLRVQTGNAMLPGFRPDIPLPGHLNKSMLPPLNCSAWPKDLPVGTFGVWRTVQKKTRVPWIGPRKLQHVPAPYPKQSIKANMNSTTLRSS